MSLTDLATFIEHVTPCVALFVLLVIMETRFHAKTNSLIRKHGVRPEQEEE